MGEVVTLSLPLRVVEQSPAGRHFPPVQDVPVPIVDVSGDALRGFSVWIGNTRAKSFSTLSNASRFASELRVMLKGGEL